MERNGNKWKHMGELNSSTGIGCLAQEDFENSFQKQTYVSWFYVDYCLVERLRNVLAHKSIINSRTNNWTLFDWGS